MTPMHRVKITVLKCAYDEEVASKYANLDNPNLKHCPQQKEGQVFYTYWQQPDGICDEAWKSMQCYVFALCHSGHSFFSGNFCRYPNMAVISCPDAFKTVTFKIETCDGEKEEARK